MINDKKKIPDFLVVFKIFPDFLIIFKMFPHQQSNSLTFGKSVFPDFSPTRYHPAHVWMWYGLEGKSGFPYWFKFLTGSKTVSWGCRSVARSLALILASRSSTESPMFCHCRYFAPMLSGCWNCSWKQLQVLDSFLTMSLFYLFTFFFGGGGDGGSRKI